MMTAKPFGRLSARFALFVAVLLAASLSAACMSPAPTAQPASPARQTIRGTVRIVGNEPHTLVGIIAEDGMSYAVLPAEKATAIRALLGETVDFIVIPDTSTKNPYFPDGTVKLLSWKIVK